MALGDAGGGTPLVTGGELQALAALQIFHMISQFFRFFADVAVLFSKAA